MSDRETRIAVAGCGFWSTFQVAGWREVPGARVVVVCDRERRKAEALAQRHGIDRVHDDAAAMLDHGDIDLLDVVTDVGTHERLVRLAAARRIPVICQKPLAPTLAIAEGMVNACRDAGVPLFVHENWRWQTPIRALKCVLDSAAIGRVIRARIDFITGFPVFNNQPFLRELEQFLLTDIGSHILDTARFLFGEPRTLYCRTQKVHADIKGEDVATVLCETAAGATVVCNMAYAENHLEHDRFPETYVFIEGTAGSAELAPDYWVKLTTKDGTTSKRHPPLRYPWAEPAYDVVQASIVPCCADLLAAVRGEKEAETTGEDNLKTVRMVFAAYESAATGKAVPLDA
jgi:D-apiose dehydrogenase